MSQKGSGKVSSLDVARLAGVSQATVSYVLNGRTDLTIREETRRKVHEAASQLGYRPNLAARTLVTGKTRMVELWVPSTYHSVFSHVTEQFTQLAQKNHYHVLIVHIRAETRETLAEAGLLSGRNVDAVLAFDARDLVNDILDGYPHAPPIVSLGPAYSTRTDHVGVDLFQGALEAVRHLYAQGCRRVAYAGLGSKLKPGEPRFEAYLRATEEAGFQPELITLSQCGHQGGYEAVKSHFATTDHPDGLFCWNDETAVGANLALAELGLKVALIGIDGTKETAYCVPPLSTVCQPFDEVCRIAWEYLQNRLEQPDLPVQGTVLPMRLEARASSLISRITA